MLTQQNGSLRLFPEEGVEVGNSHVTMPPENSGQISQEEQRKEYENDGMMRPLSLAEALYIVYG